MSYILKIGLSIIIGIALGFVTAIDAITTGWGITPLTSKNWTYYDNLATEDSHVYAKAFFKNNNHLPLPTEHALYFFTDMDENGEPLENRCQYRLSSKKIDVNFWSLSVYDKARKLMVNPSKRYSFNKANIIRKHDGSFNIDFASEIRAGNWLPIRANVDNKREQFVISLRLYGLGKERVESIDEINLPIIKKLECL